MGAGDWEVVKTRPETAARFAPWISGGAKVEPVSRDKDVFGDGSVIMLDMPGHTPGHQGLLVRLKSGPVLLTGDLYHSTEQVANRGVPRFNTNRADTLASIDRFQAIAKNLSAKVIIQHEPADIAKLPAFPKAGANEGASLPRSPAAPRRSSSPSSPIPSPAPASCSSGSARCAINYPDVLIIEDKYQFKPPRPFAPGGEIAGEVEAVGEGVTGWKPGDRLIAMLGHGGLAEKVVIPAKAAIPLPDERSFEEGSALILTYATTIHALSTAAGSRRARPCSCSAPPAASGWPRSSSARPMARASSPRSRPRKRPRRRATAGADEAIVYPRGPFDKDGAEGAGPAVQGGGRARTARTSSTIRSAATIPSRRLRASPGRGATSSSASRPESRGCRSTSPCSRAATSAASSGAPSPRATPRPMPPMSPTLFRLWDEGKIAPRVSRTWPLERGGEAIAHMAARKAVGKLVVTID